MSRYPVGRGLKIEVAKTMGTAKTVTAVTNAKPGVASSTAHGLADGTVGVFSNVVGMVELEGQACRVDAPATDSFALDGLDTTKFSTFVSGDFTPATAWSTLGHITQYTISGADPEQSDQTVLLDNLRQIEVGILGAQTVNMTGFSAFTTEAMGVLQSAARNGDSLLFRIKLKDGQERIFYGTPSLPGEEAQVGATLSGSFQVFVKGYALFLPAVAP